MALTYTRISDLSPLVSPTAFYSQYLLSKNLLASQNLIHKFSIKNPWLLVSYIRLETISKTLCKEIYILV